MRDERRERLPGPDRPPWGAGERRGTGGAPRGRTGGQGGGLGGGGFGCDGESDRIGVRVKACQGRPSGWGGRAEEATTVVSVPWAGVSS